MITHQLKRDKPIVGILTAKEVPGKKKVVKRAIYSYVSTHQAYGWNMPLPFSWLHYLSSSPRSISVIGLQLGETIWLPLGLLVKSDAFALPRVEIGKLSDAIARLQFVMRAIFLA